MNYRLDKYGNEISILGFGCMRFPQKLCGLLSHAYVDGYRYMGTLKGSWN